MNTLRYIDLIFDAMPLEVIEKNKGLRLDIHFLAEALYGDRLTVGYVAEESVWQFEVSANDEKVLCRARIELTM